MIEFIKENIISIIALGVSLISLFFTVRRELKSIIRISIKPCQGECVYFTRVDSLICYGIIVCRVKITNKSNTACGINDIYLKLGSKKYEAEPFNEIVVTNSADVKFLNVHTHIPEHMRLNSENIFNNLLLQPYETRKVYITFASSISIPEEIVFGNKRAKLKMTVANRKFTSRLRVQLISGALKQEWEYFQEKGMQRNCIL